MSVEGNSKAAKAPIRWDWIEEQWQLNRLSNVQIAKRHKEQFGREISEGIIRHHASQYGWQRDLSEAIKRETRRKLAEGAIPSELREVANETPASQIVAEETATVDAASDQSVSITLQHRSHAERMHAMATALECYVVAKLPLYDDGSPQLNYEPGELKDIATAASCASNTRGKAIDIERKAYGLDDADRGRGNDSLPSIRSFLLGEL